MPSLPNKCHAKPTKKAGTKLKPKLKMKGKPKKGNKGRHLGPQAKGKSHAAPAKRAPIGTKPHRGKKHPCA